MSDPPAGRLHPTMRRAAVIMALLVATSAGAERIAAYGPGCGEWTQARTRQGPPAEAYRLWLLGFLSGVSVGMKVDLMARQDNDALVSWLDTYCQAHPQDRASAGAVGLATELLQRRSGQ